MPTTDPRVERRVQTFPAPAPGAEMLITPTGQGAIQVLSLRWQLTASAVAGNRTPVLVADDGTSTWWQSTAPAPIVPSATQALCAFPGAIPGGGDGGGPVDAGTTGVAAAGGNAALPAGVSVTGFDLIFEAGTAAVAGQVTVTNAVGGTLTYDVQQETTGPTSIIERYPGAGLAAVAAGSAITVTVPAMVGGGAWSLVVYGTTAVGAARQLALPREGIHLRRGMRLRTITAGLDVADQYSLIVAYVQEFPDAPDDQFDPTMPTNEFPLDS